MDTEGLGRKLLLTPSRDPRRTPEKQTVGTVTASQKMPSLQALSSSLNAGPGKGGCLGPRRGFWVPSGSLFPRTAASIYHVAEMTTELMRFEPEICICNGNELQFKRESVSVMRDFLLKFPQICLCNGN